MAGMSSNACALAVGKANALHFSGDNGHCPLIFLFTGEGAHSAQTDVASLQASPSWSNMEHVMGNICHLETFLHARLNRDLVDVPSVKSVLKNASTLPRHCDHHQLPVDRCSMLHWL